MKMTTFEGYENLSQADKEDFIKTWMLYNHHNVDIKIESTSLCGDVKVKALDKQTSSVICEYNDKRENLGNLELYAQPNLVEDFAIKTVAKPGDVVYYIDVDFDVNEDYNMYTRENNIKTATVTSINGTNDSETDICLSLTRFENDKPIKLTLVQQACFKRIEDAKEACRRMPENGFKNWEDYVNVIRDIIAYEYEIKFRVKRGETMVIERKHDIWSLSTENEAQTVFHKVRASRVVFKCEHSGVEADIQLTPWLHYDDEWIDSVGEPKEVVVTPAKFGYNARLDGFEVTNLVSTYKTKGHIEFIGMKSITIPAHELSGLRRVIKTKEAQLFDELAKASAENDMSAYSHLKQLQLQCSAELRLLYYLENNQGNPESFMVC